MSPAETRKTREVPVSGDPLTAGLDGQGRQVSVGDDIPLRPGLPAQLLEDVPMASPWGDDHRVRSGTQRVGEREHPVDGRWWREHSRMRGDPHEAAQDDLRETERLGRCDGRLQPAAVAVMVGGACMEGIDQDIDVRQDQRSVPSMRSSNAAESSRSTPGRSLLPAKTGSLAARCRGRRSRLASDSRTASSMTEFSVLPERAASTFSRASSSSSSRMVVLMHRSMRTAHQSVKSRAPGSTASVL